MQTINLLCNFFLDLETWQVSVIPSNIVHISNSHEIIIFANVFTFYCDERVMKGILIIRRDRLAKAKNATFSLPLSLGELK